MDEPQKTIEELLQRIAFLEPTVAALHEENRLLREQLEQQQRTGARQAAPFRRRESKKVSKDEKKRPGRKPGHPGACRPVPKHVDQEIEKPLAGCPQCGEVYSTHPLQTSCGRGAAKVQLGPRALAVATANETLFHVDKSRGSVVPNKILGEHDSGVLVSDCLASYDPLDCRKHKCIAHHLRAIAEAKEWPDHADSAYLNPWTVLFQVVIVLVEGGILPLHPTLVQHLREWLESRKLMPKDKLFSVYSSLSHVLNRDLAFAGIEKRDALDRVIDVHALRHTHCTILQGQAGVTSASPKNQCGIRV